LAFVQRKVKEKIMIKFEIMQLHPILQKAVKKIKRLFIPPEDPHEYALVGARVLPKPPTLRAKAAFEESQPTR
jgi:hypothetical protein